MPRKGCQRSDPVIGNRREIRLEITTAVRGIIPLGSDEAKPLVRGLDTAFLLHGSTPCFVGAATCGAVRSKSRRRHATEALPAIPPYAPVFNSHFSARQTSTSAVQRRYRIAESLVVGSTRWTQAYTPNYKPDFHSSDFECPTPYHGNETVLQDLYLEPK